MSGVCRPIEGPVRWVNFQTRATEHSSSVEASIRALWHEYLVDILGIPPAEAQLRIEAELTDQLHSGLLNALESKGWVFQGAVVLDLGCGTGALASALTSRGASVIGVEPSPAWATVAQQRLRGKDCPLGEIIIADGNNVPLANRSVDYVLSLQVLEHVPLHDAKQIIREIARVLRPQGRVYLAFENYCSFWEPHYRVRWLPYLPKPVGVTYLRLLKRNPRFFTEHIYYNSYIRLAQTCLQSGLARAYWNTLADKVERPETVMGPVRRRVARLVRLLPMNLRNMLIVSMAERSQFLRTTILLELTRG